MLSPLGENDWSYISDDITEIMTLQQELREKAKSLEEALNTKSRFLAVMSHGNPSFFFLV
jgi:hypothetical protein